MTDGGTRSRLREQLALLAWLVLVWNLLWGTWSWGNLVSGLLIALLVTVVLPLPTILGGLRIHPLGLLRFVIRFFYDLVVSSVQVAWLAFRPGGPPQGAIISVDLRTDSDLLLTILSETLCLIPGSIVIDLDRERLRMALHVVHVENDDDVEDQKTRVVLEEERVVRAFGGPRELAALSAAPRGTVRAGRAGNAG